jgi:hypothetical protein
VQIPTNANIGIDGPDDVHERFEQIKLGQYVVHFANAYVCS